MEKNTIIYIKHENDTRTPVTVRILWFPDGTIKPLAYWLPDGAFHVVKYVCETTPCAFLKDKGVGLRFKVESEPKDEEERDETFLQMCHENYLYFADDWFCGKNIIDNRYRNPGKEYITVTLDVFSDASYELISFQANGSRYAVAKTLTAQMHSNYHTGGSGLRHKVAARILSANESDEITYSTDDLLETELYFEINKWFVTRKAAG
ncbi:MAG: hypothetical protein LBC96_09840 [Lachnospiraceae bacterium]|jgi:hypothetical protein|nr:hypothetical protein [Lachnospiraceae bacterium]